MPSRAEIRGVVETALRAMSFLVLAWMFWLSLDRSRPQPVVAARTASLSAALRDWTAGGSAPGGIAIRLDSVPAAFEREWLRALAGAGSVVKWTGSLPAVAVEAQRVASPAGGWNVLVAAPDRMRVRISDEIGALDTADITSGGARFIIPSASGSIEAYAGSAVASAPINDSVQLKRLLVIGGAGWETKFVVAALEEAGWKVDSDMHVAPGVNVTQGSVSPIDTSRYSAVIALDAITAPRAAEISRFVDSGGGVILTGQASSAGAFRKLRAGEPGRVQSAAAVESEPGSITLASLQFAPIVSLEADAIPLDRRRGTIVSAARRYGTGRVLQEGYLDTWRWRMAGGDASVAEHRAWWTKAVAAVAYAPHSATAVHMTTDNAPVARLIDALGPGSRHARPTLAVATGSLSLSLLFAILCLSLLAEWISRRLRGLR